MTDKHTPGPWTNTGRISASDSRLLISSDEGDIAIVAAVDLEEELANARLIASAPDLLAALVAMVKVFGKDGHGGEYEDGEFPLIDQARAAIGKAEGQN